MCEPLKGKERTWYEYGEHTDHESIDTPCFNKSDVKSAVEFYKEYKYHEAMLRDKEKKAWEHWLKSDEFKIYKKKLENKNYLIAEAWYTDWLFDYCFADVVKND